MSSDTPDKPPKGETPQHCPVCGANLAEGNVHWPGCSAASLYPPIDADINFTTMRAADDSDEQDASCTHKDCDRCKVKVSAKGGCYHKNEEGCAVEAKC